MTTETESKILKRLQTWQEKEGTLPGSLDLYRRLLNIQNAATLRIGTPGTSLDRDIAHDRLTTGHPLLNIEELSPDWSLLGDIFTEVSAVLSSYSKTWADLTGSRQFPPQVIKETATAWFAGNPLPVSGDNESLWEFVIQASLLPFLASKSEVLSQLVDQELWRRGYCPICGGVPDFAFLDRERGARRLLCSRCNAEWLFQRLECPYCGTQDQNSLSFFTDDKGLYRLYVCEQCRHYLKAIDLRQTQDEVLLPLERFLTLDIDIQAQGKGYMPPPRTTLAPDTH